MIRPTEGPRTAAARVGSKPLVLWAAAEGGAVASLVVGFDFDVDADGVDLGVEPDVEHPASASAARAPTTASKEGPGTRDEPLIDLSSAVGRPVIESRQPEGVAAQRGGEVLNRRHVVGVVVVGEQRSPIVPRSASGL